MRGCQLVNLFQNVVCFQRNIPRTLNPSSMNYFRVRCHNCSYLKEQIQATEQQWGRTYYTVLLQSHMHSSMQVVLITQEVLHCSTSSLCFRPRGEHSSSCFLCQHVFDKFFFVNIPVYFGLEVIL